MDSATSKQKKPRPKKDPNEPIPSNWQRRPHVSDKIPIILPYMSFFDSSSKQITSKTNDSLVYTPGDFVFVAEIPEPPTSFTEGSLGAPPPAFRIARILDSEPSKVRVNWLVRPSDVYFHTKDSRELMLTFEVASVQIEQLRGKCTVQCLHEIRNLAKYREKPAQFWFSRLFYATLKRTYSVIPTQMLKSLGARLISELSLIATYSIVDCEAAKLMEPLRKRKANDDSVEDMEVDQDKVNHLAAIRAEWPFRFLNKSTKEFSEPRMMPKPQGSRVGAEFQATIQDWPGRPLTYYTSLGPSKLRLVEKQDDAKEEVDPSKPWVQLMPNGYIARGGDMTSTPVSLPVPLLPEFVSKAQTSYAESIGVHPSNLNFIHACCSTFIGSRSVDDALVTVSRLTKRTISEPELSAEELKIFKEKLNPFKQLSWHEVYKAVGSKPVVELCQYYWVDMPLQAMVPPSRLIWDAKDIPLNGNEDASDKIEDDKNESLGIVCAMCFTDSSPEWKSLPGFFPLFCIAEYNDSKIALCSRCARLWYRYKTRWVPPPELESRIDELDGSCEVEPDVIEDTRSYIAEQDRRSKRRSAAQEKKEAVAKKREEAKQAKKAAKEAKKLGKPIEEVKIETDYSSGNAESTTSANATKSTDSKSSDIIKSATAKTSTSKSKTTNRSPGKSNGSETISQSSPSTGKKAKPTSKVQQNSQKSKQHSTNEKEREKSENQVLDEEATTEEEITDGDKSSVTRKKSVAPVSQMSLDQVDIILDSIDELSAPETAGIPNYCVVCCQLDPSMPQITCLSCGLNVHTACYGTPASWMDMKLSASTTVSSAWFCDCCRNGHGETMFNRNYQCAMCPQRAPVYGSWLNGADSGVPDAIKNTLEKSWCHIRCAVWMPGARFGNPSQYSDIDLSGVLSNHWHGECQICLDSPQRPKMVSLTPIAPSAAPEPDNTQSLTHTKSLVNTAGIGAKVKCDLCDDRFHVSCAADKGFQLGFTKEKDPRPVVVCSKHLDQDLVPMSKIDMNMNLTAMQIYVGTHKASKRRYMSANDRIKERRSLDESFLKTQSLILPAVENGLTFKPPSKCHVCQRKEASYWHKTNEFTIICPQCFRGLNHCNTWMKDTDTEKLRKNIPTRVFSFLKNGN